MKAPAIMRRLSHRLMSPADHAGGYYLPATCFRRDNDGLYYFIAAPTHVRLGRREHLPDRCRAHAERSSGVGQAVVIPSTTISKAPSLRLRLQRPGMRRARTRSSDSRGQRAGLPSTRASSGSSTTSARPRQQVDRAELRKIAQRASRRDYCTLRSIA